MEKLKSINIKKIIKAGTILLGFVLVIFVSFFSISFDFSNFDWGEWGASSSMLVGIMIFGILMGTSIGGDMQKEKKGGRYQVACNDYTDMLLAIESIRIYFSQFWIWYKERQLKEKKVEYLVDNNFDIRVAQLIINNIEKDDLIIGKLGYDSKKPNEKVFVKGDIKLKKLNEEELEHVNKAFKITLETFGDSYYLSLFDSGVGKTKESEKGIAIKKKIARDKRNGLIMKIASSLIISIVWSALTIKEFTDGGDASAKQKAWLNLISRINALVTSFVSGYSTSVINVRDEADAIENKKNILSNFKASYENKSFVPETYEQMIERELKEQIKNENNEKINESVDIVQNVL